MNAPRGAAKDCGAQVLSTRNSVPFSSKNLPIKHFLDRSTNRAQDDVHYQGGTRQNSQLQRERQDNQRVRV